MLSLCVCVKLLYVGEEAGGGGEATGDSESKTRTPHKVVGMRIQLDFMRFNQLNMRIYWIWSDLSWDLMEVETPTPSTPKRFFFSTLTLLKALSVTTPEGKATQPGLAHKALGARP